MRTARQVIVNGGWAAAGAMTVPHQPALGWAIVVGSLAAAQADTWATEIGAHSPEPPRLITTGRPTDRGTSGAVSPLGTAGGALGALAMAGLAAAAGVPMRLAIAGALAGTLGMLVDSLLGATLQGAYLCHRCGARCERPAHCAVSAERVAGLTWLDNDGVNLAATSVGALAAVALAGWRG
jgi:uncharacterized protein (TIGR00297 family)